MLIIGTAGVRAHDPKPTRGNIDITVKAAPLAMRVAIASTFDRLLSLSAMAPELPTLGHIAESGKSLTEQQSSGKVAIDWTSSSIGPGDSVTVRPPTSFTIALHGKLGQNPSAISGSLAAKGHAASKIGNGHGGRRRDHDRLRCALDAVVTHTGATSNVRARDTYRAV
jgi:filamentous hemagglutinin family protein